MKLNDWLASWTSEEARIVLDDMPLYLRILAAVSVLLLVLLFFFLIYKLLLAFFSLFKKKPYQRFDNPDVVALNEQTIAQANMNDAGEKATANFLEAVNYALYNHKEESLKAIKYGGWQNQSPGIQALEYAALAMLNYIDQEWEQAAKMAEKSRYLALADDNFTDFRDLHERLFQVSQMLSEDKPEKKNIKSLTQIAEQNPELRPQERAFLFWAVQHAWHKIGKKSKAKQYLKIRKKFAPYANGLYTHEAGADS
ncbi:MAG: hypothetical protein JJT94_03270 [Bernardetiaceae bacterium]|nr:hypothetical protein [Bernardetiaceae bacterium]